MAVYCRVHNYACVHHCEPGGRWWQPTITFMAMHAVTCRLTAEYGISSIPQHSSYEYGSTFTFIKCTGYSDTVARMLHGHLTHSRVINMSRCQ